MAYIGSKKLFAVRMEDTSVFRALVQGTLTEITAEMLQGVTKIRDNAFAGYSGLIKVTIPENVKSIGSGAFDGCTKLKNISIPNSIERFPMYILSATFGMSYELQFNEDEDYNQYLGNSENPYLIMWSGYASEETFAFKDGTKIIGGNGFSTEFTVLDIPDQITSLEDYAIGGACETVNIGAGLKYVSSKAFEFACLKEINVSATNETYSSVSGILYDKAKTVFVLVPDGIVTANIPETITQIPSNVFKNKSDLTSVTISNSVTSIGQNAFYGCTNLTSITIPSSVTSIGSYAFYGCTSLSSVTIPSSVTSIGSYAFYGCTSLSSVTIPSSVTSIGSSAFSRCSSLQSITIPFVGGSVKTASDTYQYPFGYIFGTSSYSGGVATKQYYYGAQVGFLANKVSSTYCIPSTLKSVTVTGGDILAGAFSNCSNLETIIIPNTATSIGEQAFQNCTSLTSITIPSSVTRIDTVAFSNCNSLTSITFPAGASVSVDAIYKCTGLKSVVYEGKVASSSGQFSSSGCSNVEKYDFRNNTGDIPTLPSADHFGHAAGCKIIVPDGQYSYWKAKTNWSALTDVVWVKASEYTEE